MKVENNDLLFAKVKPNALIPTKSNENAGYDFYACIDKEIVIEPHGTKLIPTGIACAMSENYYMQLLERGSTGSKGIKESCGVIDSSYRGEIFAAIHNTHPYYLIIGNFDEVDLKIDLNMPYGKYLCYPKTKAICQGVILPVPKMNIKEVSYEQLLKYETDRGDGSLGSSGK